MTNNQEIINEILKKNNQAIYDNVTPKSALISSCLQECVNKMIIKEKEIIERIKEEVYIHLGSTSSKIVNKIIDKELGDEVK